MIYVLTSGDHDDYRVDALVSGDGDLTALEAEFKAICREHDPEFNYFYEHIETWKAMGLWRKTDKYVHTSHYFGRWLVRDKGFTEVDYAEHQVD